METTPPRAQNCPISQAYSTPEQHPPCFVHWRARRRRWRRATVCKIGLKNQFLNFWVLLRLALLNGLTGSGVLWLAWVHFLTTAWRCLRCGCSWSPLMLPQDSCSFCFSRPPDIRLREPLLVLVFDIHRLPFSAFLSRNLLLSSLGLQAKLQSDSV